LNFDFTDEQKMLRESVRNFIERECKPELMRKFDLERIYPSEILAKMAPLGWYSAFTPVEHGGQGLGPMELAIMSEEVARFSPSIATGYYMAIWGVLNIAKHGSPAHKDYYLPRVNEGRQTFSFSMTEPDAGSDAASLRTRAVLEGDEWVINGEKVFSTQAAAPNNTIILCARTDASSTKHKGISLLFVPHDAKGLTMTRLTTMSRRMLGNYALSFENVRVPRDAVLGEPGQGWSYIVDHLERERMTVAASCVGFAKQTFAEIVDYLRQRKQFGKALGEFQAIQHTVADLKVALDCAEMLVYKVAWMLERGIPCNTEAAECKLFCTETQVKIAFEGMRLLGGYGLTEDFGMARAFREGMGAITGGGTSNIQRNIIARNILRGS